MSDSVELSNGRIQIVLQASKGTFDLVDIAAERAAVVDVAVSVQLSNGRSLTTLGAGVDVEGPIPFEDRVGRGSLLHFRRESDEHEPELIVTVSLYDDMPYAVIEAQIANRTPGALRIDSFQVLDAARLDLASAPSTWRFYKHGWQSWSPTLVLDCAGEDIPMSAPVIAPRAQPEACEGRFVSELMTAVVSPGSGQGVVAGFVSGADQASHVWLDREGGRLTATSYSDGITVPPGGRLSSERLLIEPTRAPLEAMEHYGDALGKSMDARASNHVASGWCSWYQYWHGITEEAVLANLRELESRRDELPLDYVQIDDGWQAEIGDWLEVNEKFPRGLKWLVERIHEAGFKAGLWLAPFLMGAKSRLWKEHPEWAVEYRPCKPFIAMQNWGQDCYALDLTRPDVVDWLKTVFRTVRDEWGFDYVKIDFVYAGSVDGIRSDPEVTRAQAYRRGIEAIREAVGDRFILGCGNPMGANVGIVDGARISPDVAPYWHPPRSLGDRGRMSEPSALNAIRNTINRWWMNGRLWQNDPDCVLVRDVETALTADEVRTLATVIAMSGGMVLDSDDLTRLSEERREWLALLLPPYGKAARPLDLFESEIPSLLELDVDSHRMLAVFNWDQEAAKVEAPLPAQAVRVFDAWSGEDLGVGAGPRKLNMTAHGCRLLAVKTKGVQEEQDEAALPPLFRWSRFEARD